MLIVNQRVSIFLSNSLDLLVLDGTDRHVVSSDIIHEHRCQVITMITIEFEKPSCYHTIINAMTSFLGRAWRRATGRCPIETPFINIVRANVKPGTDPGQVVPIDSSQRHDDAVAIGTDDLIPLDVTPRLQFPLTLLA